MEIHHDHRVNDNPEPCDIDRVLLNPSPPWFRYEDTANESSDTSDEKETSPDKSEDVPDLIGDGGGRI
jgi:hypothetical protein